MRYLITFLVYIFCSSISYSQAIEDGIYFSSVYDTKGVRWDIELDKYGDTLTVLSMRVGPAKVVEDAAAFIEFDRLDLSEKIKPTQIDDGDFNFTPFNFVRGVKIKFYGNLEKYSKLTYEIYDGWTISARHIFLKFEHYDSFLKILNKKEKFTTEQYRKILKQ